MNDWDNNPDKYLTDSDGNFIFKKDGTPRLKGCLLYTSDAADE